MELKMAKAELVKVASPEIPPIKTKDVEVVLIDQRNKSVVVSMPDSLTLQALMDDPKLWRSIQGDRTKALNEDDRVELRWFDKRAYTAVDYADANEVVLLKPDVRSKRERDRTPWKDNNYEVRSIHGGWSYFRISDDVRMSSALYPTWEAARAACIREQYPARVA
jgi:hypothetical protein